MSNKTTDFIEKIFFLWDCCLDFILIMIMSYGFFRSIMNYHKERCYSLDHPVSHISFYRNSHDYKLKTNAQVRFYLFKPGGYSSYITFPEIYKSLPFMKKKELDEIRCDYTWERHYNLPITALHKLPESDLVELTNKIDEHYIQNLDDYIKGITENHLNKTCHIGAIKVETLSKGGVLITVHGFVE